MAYNRICAWNNWCFLSSDNWNIKYSFPLIRRITALLLNMIEFARLFGRERRVNATPATKPSSSSFTHIWVVSTHATSQQLPL
jgi:hypothetical protein